MEGSDAARRRRAGGCVMKGMAADIRHCLTFKSEPVSAREIAEEIATAADTWEVRNALTGMVHAGKVQRHHNADGILRYSLIDAQRTRDAAPESDQQAPVESQQRAHPWKRGAPLQEKLLEIIGERELTLAELNRAAQGELTEGQVRNLLYVLKVHGLVQRVGKQGDARWRRTGGAIPAAPKVEVAPPPIYQVTVTASCQKDFDSLVTLLTLISKMSSAITLKKGAMA